ncbi:RagB/SusD family nutrient uptake outer membrane protein [Larkinella rosea]|uniref:RagB/SusD family nutrient uptake outer membrane protein n=1 Tax=Larkinella rosea TaxID=2025312 RepID=A0A3P1BP07_9BACT|nr:RagB/SusD family nutrient uptake outer membrane protein [Larkinella rosea]RRB02799.1 RagB/SusD family nutrient uptake outer membrane protein [Larkinella rosea]
MKKIITILSVSLVLGLSACDNRLNLQPTQSIDAETALLTEQDVESAIIGAYGQLGNGALYGTNMNLLSELQGAEGYITWRGTFASYREVYQKTTQAINTDVQRTWMNGYAAINTVNNVLESLDKVQDASKKAQLEGEARFVRGILYFELARYYGLPWGATADNSQPGVPIVLRATITAEQAAQTAARNTVAQVYAQAIDDLTKASTLLPDDNGTRADKYAALAFLSRVYLQQSDYAKALNAANQVIVSGQYRLNPSVTSAFRNRNTSESIFEIQQNDQNNAGTSNDGLTTLYASLPVNGVNIGRGDIQINTSFVTSYDSTDARRTELLYIGYKGVNRYYTGKYTDFGANIPVIRLAEMMLVRAECNLRLNSTVGATPAADLNAIRQRAGIAPIAAPTIQNVLTERVKELAFEGLRIHDIKRTKGKTGDLNWNDPKLVLPIPKREVDANNLLVQNPGY